MKQRLVPLVILFVAAGFLHAQDDVTILLQSAGTLSSGDESYRERLVDWYEVQAPSSGRLEILVLPVDFAPVILIESDRIIEVPGNTDSARTTRTVTAGQTVTVGVSAAGENLSVADSEPEYTLTVQFREGLPALSANGATVGELVPGDEKGRAGGFSDYIDWYSLPVTEAGRLRVEVSSDDFLPYLILELPGGERHAHDGDYGVVPRLSVIVRQAGTARVGIMGSYADATGEYEVLVSHMASEALSIDSTIRATLDGSEALFAVHGRPGEVIDVRLTPDGFRAALRISDPDGWDTRSDTIDRTASLNYIVGDSGLALISVHTYSSGGSYVLEVARPETPYETPPDGFRLEGGERVAGVITSDSPSYYGSHYQRFTFLAEAGERIEITLESNSFEPHLRMIDPQGYEISLRSQIVATILASGVHEIYAGPPPIEAFFMRPRIPLTGAYTMAFNRLPESPVVLSTAGFLAGIDERDADGYEKDRLQFRLVAGETATIDVTSGAFDTEILLRDGSGNQIARSHDGEQERSSRIVFTPTHTGTYILEIFAHSSQSFGGYRVEVVQ